MSKARISIGSWAYIFNQEVPTNDFHKILHKLQDLGYDGVELGSFGPHPSPASHPTMREAMTATIPAPKPARPCYALARRNPRLILGIGGRMAAELALLARSQGWDVVRAVSGADVRRLARGGRGAVVLPADGEATLESGYLVCVKLLGCQPGAKVWLVGSDSDRARRRAEFAGAAGYIAAGDRLAPVFLAG